MKVFGPLGRADHHGVPPSEIVGESGYGIIRVAGTFMGNREATGPADQVSIRRL
jgi:hypothetical protein